MRLLLEVLRLSLSTLRENKLRSFLTVLGVIIGTGTIIGVGSILTGLDSAVTGAIRSFGTNSAIVFKFPIGPGANARTPEERARKPLTYENGLAIQERCPSVEHVSPFLLPPPLGVVRARYKGNDYFQPQINGTDEAYNQADMKTGRCVEVADPGNPNVFVLCDPGITYAQCTAQTYVSTSCLPCLDQARNPWIYDTSTDPAGPPTGMCSMPTSADCMGAKAMCMTQFNACLNDL